MSTINLFQNTTDFESFSAGQVVFEQGQSGKKMYVILEGEVNVLVNGNLVETLEPGTVVGEMALIEDGLRSATAVASTDCKLVALNEQRFAFLVQHNPYFATQLLEIMSQRIRRMNKQFA